MDWANIEEKRKYAREAKARQRAAMTPEERADKRRQYDENFREAHRTERQAYDRARYKRQHPPKFFGLDVSKILGQG